MCCQSGNKIKTFLLILFLGLPILGTTQEDSSQKNQVSFIDSGTSIIVKTDGKPVFEYNYEVQLPPFDKPDYFKRSGFIHPVYTPSGDTITEGFPTQHTHHHGIFSAWVSSTYQGNQIDFWNQQKQEGTVIFKEVISIKEQNRNVELKTKHHHIAFMNNDTIPILEEIWTITVYNSSKPFVWDIAIEQKNITQAPFRLNQYHYGGLAVRGRDQWNYANLDDMEWKDNQNFRITTNTTNSREQANHSQPKWISMSGQVNNKSMNLTVIPYSNNHNLPEFVRVHAEMPYFSFTPVVKEGYTIQAGATFKSKYRILTSTNNLTPSQIKSFLPDL